MGSSPQHKFMAQSSVDMSKGLQLELDFRYVSAFPGKTGLPGQYVQAYETADASLGWRLNSQFDLSFVGRNLLQPHHPEFGSDPSADPTAVALVGIRRRAKGRLIGP